MQKIAALSVTGGNPDFTAFNGEVLFDGTDAAGDLGLWVTNGTAAGTHELTGISGAYTGGLLDDRQHGLRCDIWHREESAMDRRDFLKTASFAGAATITGVMGNRSVRGIGGEIRL